MDLKPFRGAQVRNLTTDDVREIYEMRVLLEPFALEKAVPRMDENDRGLLRSLLEDADDAAERWTCTAFPHSAESSTTLSLRGAATSLIETMDKVQDQLRAISLRAWMPKPIYLREAEQHRRVAKAVESRNVHRAAGLLRVHIVGFEEQFVRTLEHQHIETGQIRRR